jgi:hypothetical protein
MVKIQEKQTVAYRCIEGFILSVKGTSALYHVGDVVFDGDVGLRERPKAFRPVVPPHVSPPVEQATAAPGEMRG